MGGLLIGILLGVIGKLVYDSFKQQDLPDGAADVQRRAASLLEETRQMLQDVRKEVTTAAGTATERVAGIRDAATGAASSNGGRGGESGATSGSPGAAGGTGGSGGASGSGSGSGSSSSGSSSGG